MSSAELDYPCVGVCMVDAESGYCLGCGRPPLAAPATGTANTDAAAGMAVAASSAAAPTPENASAAVAPAASNA